MLFEKPVVAIVYNVAKQTWHPCLFREDPGIHGIRKDAHKSVFYHTEGFKTLASAQDNILNQYPHFCEEFGNKLRIFLDYIVPWDGFAHQIIVTGDFADHEHKKQVILDEVCDVI